MKLRTCFYILLFTSILIAPVHAQQKGNASYYASRFQGKKTSSGILYHKDSLTCAHKTLPFGTLLFVKNTLNNKTVLVKVTDRGPRSKKRIIDLSYEAARQLDIIGHGIAHVEISEWKFCPELSLLKLDTDRIFLPAKTLEEIYESLHGACRSINK